jgi:hypothetical protein
MNRRYKLKKLLTITLLFTTISKIVCGQDATATIKFEESTGILIQEGAFGLNLFQGFNPTMAGTPGNTTYKNNVAFMKPGMVRHHSMEMMLQSNTPNGWLTASNGWDAAKINLAMAGAYSFNPIKMMNIPTWPTAWQDANGKLKAANYADFANWCASLVKIVNIDQGRAVKYWEVTNERDEVYTTNCEELGTIYNLAATAMKQVDPTIKVGGPSFARPDITSRLNDFFSVAAPNLDFVSYHTYANGTPNSPVNDVYNSAVNNGGITGGVRAAFETHSNKPMEYYHNEFNISWAPPDPHQTNHVSMIFDALLATTAIKNRATGTTAWNEADGWYGKLDHTWARRPSAFMYNTLNTNILGGTVNTSTSSNNSSLVVMASSKGTLRHVIVINRANADQKYKFTFTGLTSEIIPSTKVKLTQNLASGGTMESETTYGQLTNGSGQLFPKNTVTLVTLDISGSKFTPTSWVNTFSGNIISDANQTTTHSSSVTLNQNEELQMVVANANQGVEVYKATFASAINLTNNSEFHIDIKSNAVCDLRIRLFDVNNNYVDSDANTIAIMGDNTKRSYSLNFASSGFGMADVTNIKGVSMVYNTGNALNGILYIDNLKLGQDVVMGIEEHEDKVQPEIYPNATTGSFTVKCTLHESETIHLTVLNTLSKTVLSTSKPGKVGINEISLSLADYPDGIYLVSMEVGGAKVVKRIVLTK